MKILQKILFTLVLMAGCTLAASAQRDGDKKPPPKSKPPVVTPQPKPPPDDSKKGRHGALALAWIREGQSV